MSLRWLRANTSIACCTQMHFYTTLGFSILQCTPGLTGFFGIRYRCSRILKWKTSLDEQTQISLDHHSIHVMIIGLTIIQWLNIIWWWFIISVVQSNLPFEPSHLKSNLMKLVELLSLISANLEAAPRVLLWPSPPTLVHELWLRLPNIGEILGY